jgi:uncharacterized protein YjbI with pentapeptide repeats
VVPVNRNNMSLYREAKAGLSSLVKQTAQVFIGLMVMLLLTGGNPPGFIVALSFCLGVGFVAWNEKERLLESKTTFQKFDSEEKRTTFVQLLIQEHLPKDIHPNKQAVLRRKINLLSSQIPSRQKLQELIQLVVEAKTDDFVELIKIADLNWTEDLTGADLKELNLVYIFLSGADLRYTNLSNTNLNHANFKFAILSGANLSGADLSNANLDAANLKDADLSDTKLIATNLRYTYFYNANLSGADLSGADLSGADLSGANVKNARFRNNLGISETMKRDLILRGAIFEDFPPHQHSNVLVRI